MRWILISVISALVLGACENNQPSQTAAPAAPPTLDINAIPVLGADHPPPPIPLVADDPRYPIQAAASTEGRASYDRFCAACHGPNGEGQQPDPYAPGAAPPHNDTGHTWHHADQQNFATVWNGLNVNGIMPAYHDRMSPDEIIAVLAYIKTWWTADQLTSQFDLTQRLVDGVSSTGSKN